MKNKLIASALILAATSSAALAGPVEDATDTLSDLITPLTAGVGVIVTIAALFVAPKFVKRLFGKA